MKQMNLTVTYPKTSGMLGVLAQVKIYLTETFSLNVGYLPYRISKQLAYCACMQCHCFLGYCTSQYNAYMVYITKFPHDGLVCWQGCAPVLLESWGGHCM